MDSKETASSPTSEQSPGSSSASSSPSSSSSSSSSSFDSDIAKTVPETNDLNENNDNNNNNNIETNGDNVTGSTLDRVELEQSIDNVEGVNKVGVLEGEEVVVVEGDKVVVNGEEAGGVGEGERNDFVGGVGVEKGTGEGDVGDPVVGSVGSVDNGEKPGGIGVLEGGEVVEGEKDVSVDGVEVEKGTGEANSSEPFLGSGQEPVVENVPVTDDVGEVGKDEVLEGGEVVEGGKDVVVGSEVEVPVDGDHLGNGKVEERGVEVADGVVEVVKGSGGDEGEKDVVLGSVSEGSKVEEVEVMDKEIVEPTLAEDDKGVTKKVEESGVIEKVDTAEVEPKQSELVESDGLKFTPEGDSVVEDIHVELPEPGVVVVGEAEESENVQSKLVEVPCSESVALVKEEEVAKEGAITVEEEPVVSDVVLDKSQKSLTDDYAGSCATVESSLLEGKPEMEIEQAVASQTKENGTVGRSGVDGEVENTDGVSSAENNNKAIEVESSETGVRQLEAHEGKDDGKHRDEEGDFDRMISDEETDGVIFGSSQAAKQFIEELELASGGGDGSRSIAESSRDNSQRIDGQIVTDSEEEEEEEGDTEEEGEGRELFDSAALAALLKAASGADTDGGSITITSQEGSRLFSVERPAGLGSSIRSLRPAPRPNRQNLFSPAFPSNTESDNNLSEEEIKKLEKLQNIRVKYLRLLQRLGVSTEESIVNQVLYRLAIVAGKQSSQHFNMDAARRTAQELEAEGKDDLDFSVNMLVVGKGGVGKSATINSIFGEDKATIDAFEPTTTAVKQIFGYVDGVKLRVFDTPGLKTSFMDQAFNRSVLSSVKKLTKKTPLDIVLYVDRLDAPTRDLNDLPTLRTITSSLGSSIWRSAIVTLTHAASAPPDGPAGTPLSYEAFVTQRSHVVQQSIGQAVGDLRMMSPSLMNPVSLVENHPSCRKNREGQKVLPNGQTWRPQLLLLCYSMKILSEASSLSKPQDPFDHRKLFGFRSRSPPLPYMLSSMLQSRPHPKLSAEQGGDNGDSDIDLDDLSDTDQEEEDEYDQLPPFKPLRKAQISKLSNEQRKAYFEEYDYRVKLLQKKQFKEELRRMREMKQKGKDGTAPADYGYAEEDADPGAAAPVAVPLPDMALPPSFDSDNPAYRYRFLEPTSQFLARPVLDTHGWDHDCGYDGVNLEHSLAIASRFPATYTIQVTKDKKDFTISVDSSIAAKHGENGSTMAGFDIQSIGKQLAYVFRGETKFKNFKKNKTAGGVSVTFLGKNIITGVKLEDQIVLGKQYAITASAGAVRSQQDTAYGANIELQRREQDYPIGQVQSTLSMSIIKWRGDLALGFNSLAQFSIGRNSKVAVRAGINNKLSGQITVRTSSSDHLSLALAAVIPTAISIYKKLYPDAGDKFSIY